MLAKAGLGPDALECGAHWPYNDSAIKALAAAGAQPSALHNNCSGKHSGFVCLGCLMARQAGRDPAEFVRGYIRPGHPVMREVTAALAAATGADLSRAPVGTDGCSIPTYAMPLRQLALGFACCTALLIWLGAPYLAALYSNDPTVVALATTPRLSQGLTSLWPKKPWRKPSIR